MNVNFKLYLITDRNLCAPRSLLSVVREACDAGVRAVQLREKVTHPPRNSDPECD